MEDELAVYRKFIQDDLMEASDEKIISDYLKKMIYDGDTWPEHIVKDADVYNKNPRMEFDSEDLIFVIVKPKTEACGKTDGCESGCWRIMARDKLIKSEETGKILGFKKILKFCEVKKTPREYKRSWIMEEYMVANKWKQDRVICKIRLMFKDEIGSLLAKHFYYDAPLPLPAKQLFLPDYGFSLPDEQEEGAYYLQKITDSDGDDWPSYVTSNVFGLDPFTLVDPQDQMFTEHGVCFFVNRTEACGRTDKGCAGGRWRIWRQDKVIKSEDTGKILGLKRVFKFCATEEKYQFVYRFDDGDEDAIVTWTMEEYRLAEKTKQNKVICVIKFTLPMRSYVTVPDS